MKTGRTSGRRRPAAPIAGAILLALLGVSIGMPAAGQERGAGAGETPGAAERPADEKPGADAAAAETSEEGRAEGGAERTGTKAAGREGYEVLGPPLFPLYDHYRRLSDRTEVLNVLYLYQSTRNPAGDASNLLFPFYYWSRQRKPEDHRLYLFPLLFFHRRSPEVSYDYAVPFFFDHRTPHDEYRFLAPLWFRHRDLDESTTTDHVLFPFSRFRTDRRHPQAVTHGARVGIPKILELFERSHSNAETRTAALSLFNFGAEAESRIALFHSAEKRLPGGGSESRTHLFPFLWAGRTTESEYRFVVPFYFRSRAPESDVLLALPFYGRITGDERQDIYLPLLLSHFGHGPQGQVRRDILWPLYQRSYGPGASRVASFPFFSYTWTTESRKWSLLTVLYGNEHVFKTGKTAHSFLWPLGRIDVEPDGVTGHVRALPFYFDSFNAERRYRITPLSFNYRRRSGKEWTHDFTFVLPDYFGWGEPRDYFGFAFPLYWKSRTGNRGWDLLAPIYFSFFRSASWGVHVLPLVSYNSFPSEKQLFLLGPAFVHRRFYGFKGKPDGSSTSILWPLTAFERRPDSYHYRLLPLFWTSRRGDDRDLLLFPFWYRQWGGATKQDYFFAAYGRFESERIRRDFYGLGSYIHTRERDEKGAFFRDRKDILWSLFSFEKNSATHASHQHALPVGFWRSRSVTEDRTILGPLLYHHRIEGEENRSYFLDLVLGNVWFSREVRHNRWSRPDEGGAKEPRRVADVVSSEKGVLWPLFRHGFDEETGVESTWALPFYVKRTTRIGSTTGIFPLTFLDRSEDRYTPRYFRYFFLFDHERFAGGYRMSVGQLLADYMRDDIEGSRRWRFLYPLSELKTTPAGYSYQATPLVQGKVHEEGGQRDSRHFGFPLYWTGSSKRKNEDGTYTTESDYTYLFPLFGINRKSLRTQWDFLLPFFHAEQGIDSFKFQVRPFLFIRNDPDQVSVRAWPLHANESGGSAGDWWVSRYLFLSKYFRNSDGWSYRIDPFLFRISRGRESSGVGTLLELFAYDRKGSGTRAETSYRALPLLYGYSRQNEAALMVFPFYYEHDSGDRPYEFWDPLRFPFLVNHLRGGDGERLTSFLVKVAEYRDNPRRPEFHEFRILQHLYKDLRDVSFRELALQPFFFYSSNEADPLRPEKTLFLPLLLGYRYHRAAGQTRHYLFWFLPIW